jgi:hypothetical protein
VNKINWLLCLTTISCGSGIEIRGAQDSDMPAIYNAIDLTIGPEDDRLLLIQFLDKKYINPITGEKRSGAYVCNWGELCPGDYDTCIHVWRNSDCMADTSLVHELCHHWDTKETDCGDLKHPTSLFGDNGRDGGKTGQVKKQLKKKYCEPEDQSIFIEAVRNDQ